jgi:D-alanyl-D-alanine carboxypeptidase (penicillin-binding protein 5/6)
VTAAGSLRPLAVVLAAILGPVGASQAADDPFPVDAAAHLVQVQGRTLWAKEPHKRLPPASLTKIMTALLVLESGQLDAVVTVSRAAAGQGGSRLGLAAGDRLRVEDLLTAVLVRSANDACRALAEREAGSEARFVVRMNRRALALGLRDTHFANACGWDAPGHFSSASDLALLTDTALRFPVFSALVALPEARIRTADRRREFLVRNTNLMVGRLPDVVGVKTGFTRGAGRCVIVLAEREGVRVLAVLLNAFNRWWDAYGLVERAFAQASGGS